VTRASAQETTSEVLKHGGGKVGEVVTAQVSGVGMLTFVYILKFFIIASGCIAHSATFFL